MKIFEEHFFKNLLGTLEPFCIIKTTTNKKTHEFVFTKSAVHYFEIFCRMNSFLNKKDRN